MTVVSARVAVRAPLLTTVDISNRLQDWPTMMDDYAEVEILRREGAKIWFRLRTHDGASWVSWRLIHESGAFALAERHEPLAPFGFMQHVWTYSETARNCTEMRWEMRFELDSEHAGREQEASRMLLEHTTRNQMRMKAYIEAEHRARRGS